MRIGIVGAGPVGSVMAAYLSRAGQDVHVVDADEGRLAAILAGGIRLEGARALAAGVAGGLRDVAGLGAIAPDLVMIATKAYQLNQILPELAGVVGPDTPVASVQNGLDTEDLVAAGLPGRPILRVVVNYAGSVVVPGVVRMTFFNPPNYVGCRCPDGRCGHGADLAALLSDVGLETALVRDIKRHVWEKTILNASLAPICALTGLTMADVMRLRTSCGVVESLLDECVRVAARSGHDFGPGFFDTCMAYLERGGPHKPSMAQDIEAGRPTEIDFMNGRIAFYGALAGVPTPLNDAFTRLIKALAHRHAPATAAVAAR